MKLAGILFVSALAVPLCAENPLIQDDIVHKCLAAREIRMGGWHSRCMGCLTGTVENQCPEAVDVTLTAAFFNQHGDQIDTNTGGRIVGAGAQWHFRIQPTLPFNSKTLAWPHRLTKGARLIGLLP